MDFLQIVMTPFSWLMKWLYFALFENYGLALIVFALAIKVILFPLSLQGKRSMIKTNMLSGKMAEIKKACGKDTARYNEEVQKLYAREGVNPMGGCLWSLLPMAILIPLYAVVRRPLRYLMNLTDVQIALIPPIVTGAGITLTASYPEISIASAFHSLPSLLNMGQAAVGEAGSRLFGMNFNFLGIDLASTPQFNIFAFEQYNWGTIGLFLIPIVSALLGLLSSRITMKTSSMASGGNNEQMAQTNKTMMLMSPVMSLWIGFVMPASMGIYWIANNVFTIAQELLAAKLLKADYEKAAAAAAEREAQEKIEEKKKKEAIAAERARRIEEQKNNKKKQQAEKKKDGPVGDTSRVGLRAYARGRNYDPNRYGGVTEYRDPSATVDEAAVEAALTEKAQREQEAREEAEIAAAALAALEAGETAESAAPSEPEDGEPDYEPGLAVEADEFNEPEEVDELDEPDEEPETPSDEEGA